MTEGRSVPENTSDIFPDGRGLDFLNDAQIREARSTPFGVPPILPIIREPPVDVVANRGEIAKFTAEFDGTTPLRFQWLFDRTNSLSGATNSALVLSDLETAQGGTYQVSVSNLWGSATSEVAMLVIADADTDADGMPDGWEWDHDLDLHSGTDAELDADGDGLSNRQEFLAGTDPRDRESALKVENIEAPVSSDGIATIVFQGRTGRNYAVEWRRHLDRGPWQTLTNVPTVPVTQPVTVWDPSGAGQPERWYRIVLPPAP
jgi:hypothetical protein